MNTGVHEQKLFHAHDTFLIETELFAFLSFRQLDYYQTCHWIHRLPTYRITLIVTINELIHLPPLYSANESSATRDYVQQW